MFLVVFSVRNRTDEERKQMRNRSREERLRNSAHIEEQGHGGNTNHWEADTPNEEWDWGKTAD